MKLSKYFTLEEMTASQYAARHGINNTPNSFILEQLKETANKLDAIRELLKYPIIVTSGYRCQAVNRGIGSNSNSQHTKGEAVDFVTKGYTPRQIVDKILKSGITFDQLIIEYNAWVHISFKDDNNRKQALIIDKLGTRSYK